MRQAPAFHGMGCLGWGLFSGRGVSLWAPGLMSLLGTDASLLLRKRGRGIRAAPASTHPGLNHGRETRHVCI